MSAVLQRELLKLLAQKGRLISAMVRPMLWLLVIGAGIGALQSASGGAGYQSFLVPGVIGMALLFGGMLSALSTVYDKESGVMRMLVVAPVHHSWIVIAKALGATAAALAQALLLLVLLALLGYVSATVSIPILALGMLGTAFTCASLGMLVAAFTRSLDNYATMMNLVIFPVFFLSGALYPVQRLPEPLGFIATVNPFTHGVDLLKHAGTGGTGIAPGPDFSMLSDVAVLCAFSAVALAVACARFSREGANEPLIHRLARKQAD